MIEYVMRYDNLSADKEKSFDCYNNNGNQNDLEKTITLSGGRSEENTIRDLSEVIRGEKSDIYNYDDHATASTSYATKLLTTDRNVDDEIFTTKSNPEAEIEFRDEISCNSKNDLEGKNYENATTNQEFDYVKSPTEINPQKIIEKDAKVGSPAAQISHLRSCNLKT